MDVVNTAIFIMISPFVIAFGFAAFFLHLYRAMPPKKFGLLLWALFMVLSATFTHGLYGDLAQLSLPLVVTHDSALVFFENFSSNMETLAWIVPGMMLSCASRLTMDFLNSPILR